MARDTNANPRLNVGSKPVPTYHGDTIEPGGIASLDTRRLICTYISYRWARLQPKPLWPHSSRQVRPWGTLVVGGDQNDWINLGGYGSMSPETVAAVESAYPNVKQAFDDWAVWAYQQA